MYFTRKLRPPVLGTEGILGIVSIVTFFILAILSFRIAMGFGALICFVAAIVSIIVLIRTRNIYFLPLVTGQMFAVIVMLLISLVDIKSNPILIIPFAALMAASFTIVIVFTFQRKLKWRSREMLELAAQPVIEKTNGLTQRPLPAGRVNDSPEEIKAFSAFVRRNLIAIPAIENNRIVFILNMPMSRLLSFSNRYDDRTWVAFSYDGNVTVNISQDDYFLYRDSLAFDKLCQSLANLFIEFMNLYLHGEERQLMYRLNALNLNIITEG